jgi:hypothetical protein
VDGCYRPPRKAKKDKASKKFDEPSSVYPLLTLQSGIDDEEYSVPAARFRAIQEARLRIRIWSKQTAFPTLKSVDERLVGFLPMNERGGMKGLDVEPTGYEMPAMEGFLYLR